MADVAIASTLAVLAFFTSGLAARHARPAVLDLGPNDADYVAGFREDWERDGLTRFHWTGRSAAVRLPLLVRGQGQRLEIRLRRHLVEPARVTIRVEGRMAAAFDVQADPQVAYRVLELPLPPLEGRAPFVLTLDSASADPRPLGIAIDWLAIDRGAPTAQFVLLGATRVALLLVVLVAFAAPRAAGSPPRWAAVHAGVIAVAAAAGVFWDVVAAERILREGAGPYVVTAGIAVAVARWPRARRGLDIPTAVAGGALVLVTLAALAVRLVILLHPQFYYPDVRVHAMFAWQIARHGLADFLRHFTENQYRYSLGLQMENGHWYAFPYPPAFYVLCWPLVALARLRAEVAVSVVAAAVNSLEALLVFGIARRLRAGTATAIAAAAALVVLPLFIARLSLAYFPAVVGHAVDAIVILYLLVHWRTLDRARTMARLSGLVALALLTYTQSLLNFAVFVPLVLAAMLMRDHSRSALRRAAALTIAAGLGGVLSLAVFYGRYVPVALDMRRGVPMAEERILLEKPPPPLAQDAAPPEPDDPYAGPTVDPWRGLRKAGWRLYVFYGPFALPLIAGILLVARAQDPPERAFVLAWALMYVVLNLLSGGLPGPNLVRYNKDLEVVAPLCCVALAWIGGWLWVRGRWIALVYAGSFGAFGAARAVRYLTEKFVLER